MTAGKIYPPVHAGQTVSEALIVILDHDLRHLLAWQDKAYNWDDIEGVHQVRVSFRRIRSALSLLRSALQREVRQTWSARIKTLVEPTGPARDLDVLLNEALPAFETEHSLPGAEAFRELVEEKRASAYAQIRELLDGQAYKDFKREFAEWIDSRGWETGDLTGKQRKRLGKDVRSVAHKLLESQDKKALELGEAADQDDPTAMHRLRIECKKLRYATEFFYHLFDGMDSFVEHMKGLQDVLGAMHDIAVMGGMIDHLLEGRTEPELRRFADELVRWRTHENEAKKQAFGQHWRDFTDARRPWRHAH
jgi:CHAD domain-containing protein